MAWVIECIGATKKDIRFFKAICSKYSTKVGPKSYFISKRSHLDGIKEEIEWCNSSKLHIKYNVYYKDDAVIFIG